MIAIHTKFLRPTNTRGARVKAYTAANAFHNGFSATVSYHHAGSCLDAHFAAVKALVEKNNLDWDLSEMRYGDSADGKGYAFCFSKSIIQEGK
jgi:hypothetical protein